jgi:hypothetical protein
MASTGPFGVKSGHDARLSMRTPLRRQEEEDGSRLGESAVSFQRIAWHWWCFRSKRKAQRWGRATPDIKSLVWGIV